MAWNESGVGGGGGNAITFLSFSRESSSDSLDANYAVFLLEEKKLRKQTPQITVNLLPLEILRINL